MRKVLHKVKSQWIVLGVMGATIVSLGTADIQKVSAAETNGIGITGTIEQTGSTLVPDEPITISTEETAVEEVPYTTVEVVDNNLEQGKTEVRQAGINGVQSNTYTVIYTDGLETNRTLIRSEVTTVPTEEIIAVGTKDVTAPVIDISSSSVSKMGVTDGETVSVSVKITDDAGIASASIGYISPSTNQTETVYLYKNESNGLFEGNIAITNNTELGTWIVSSINAYDTYGNSASLSNSNNDLSLLSFTVTGSTANDADISNPVIDLSSIKVSQTSAIPGDIITFSANITDDVGVTGATAYYYSPTAIFTPVYLQKNEMSGLYEAVITVDNSTQSGNWSLATITATDAAGNRDNHYNVYLPAANFTVIGTDADISNPVIDLSSIKVSQTSAIPGDIITFSANITDDIGVTGATAYYYSPTAIFTPVYLQKNEMSGLYEAVITVDNSTQSGNWSLATITATDAAGNRDNHYNVYLPAANFTVIGTDADISNPVIDLSSIKVSQTSAIPGDIITFSANITDDIGVTGATAYYYSPTAIFTPVYLQKNEMSGLYEAVITVDNSTQSGNWSLATITATDAAGNRDNHYNVYLPTANFTVHVLTTDLLEITETIRYGTEEVEDPTLPIGETRVIQSGVDGSRQDTYAVTFIDGVETKRELIQTLIITDPVNEIIKVGTQSNQNKNLAIGATLSSSVPFDNLLYATDSQTDNTADYARGTAGLQWVQLDLGSSYDLNEIQLWHYYGDGRSYRDVVVQLSNDASFASGAVTVFNNDKDGNAGLGVGTDNEYKETSAGKTINFAVVNARYARFYSNGSTVNGANHYVEIEVYGVEPQTAPTVNLVPEGTISSSVPFDNSAFTTDKLTDDTADYARGSSGLQWVQVDLGAAYDLNEIQLWHYYGDGRSYHDVVVQLSNDASFSTGAVTVFNNDKDGNAGLGVGTDSEYSETSAGKTIRFAAVNARYARFYSNGSTVNGANHYVEIEIYGVEPQTVPTVNLVPEGALSSSVPFDNSSFATDKMTDDTADYARGTSGLQWVQVDLGASYDLNEIQLWHYYGDGRSYHDVIVQLSNDANFASGTVTVFNNDSNGSAGLGVGTDSEYSETSAGKTIAFGTVNARYARFYSNGSTVNGANHYVEIKVYGIEPQTAPTVNLAPEGTLSSSVPFDNSSFATDKLTDDTADYARGTSGLQWMQVDLGASYDVNEIQLWHYYGDGRSYHDVVVQLSNDETFSNGAITVFNNDKDGSAGLGVGTDNEYSETSAGKTINFDTVNARYVRFYSNGSTVNGANHYVEIEVYGLEPQIV